MVMDFISLVLNFAVSPHYFFTVQHLLNPLKFILIIVYTVYCIFSVLTDGLAKSRIPINVKI